MPWFKMVAHVGYVVTLVWPMATLSAQGLPVAPPPAPAAQNPSPMLETTRAHERLAPRALGGTTRTFPGPGTKPVELLTLVGFSAGHGAVRAILREPRHLARVDAVLLLDGMHTSYVPEGQVLAAGGMLDTMNLVSLTAFARAAARGEKHMLIAHSEIFPGTYASTTETADWTITALGLRRRPVLKWGPRGMQQVSEVNARHFRVMGFAGTTAPDHIDQLHAMPELLKRVQSR